MEERKQRFGRIQTAETERTVTIHVEGDSMAVPAGITVAAALLSRDNDPFCHSAGTRDKRAPHCLMGVCFDCLCEINGIPDRQACLTQVADGMQIKRQTDAGTSS